MTNLVPRWVAPNLLTLVGLIHAVAAYVLLLVHSPGLDGAAPPWVYVACAACLFVYQTMDGMDGKQARRTNSGSPLGEVIDHGADAIAACVYGVFICDAFGVGWDRGFSGAGRWPAVALIAYSRCAFLLDSVTATYTGRLPVSRLDAQELQIVTQLVLLWNASGGAAVWRYPLDLSAVLFSGDGGGGSGASSGGVPLGLALVGFCAGGGAFARFKSTSDALRGPPSPHLPAYAERGPAIIYLRVLSFELVLTAADHRIEPAVEMLLDLARSDARGAAREAGGLDAQVSALECPFFIQLHRALAIRTLRTKRGAGGE